MWRYSGVTGDGPTWLLSTPLPYRTCALVRSAVGRVRVGLTPERLTTHFYPRSIDERASDPRDLVSSNNTLLSLGVVWVGEVVEG